MTYPERSLQSVLDAGGLRVFLFAAAMCNGSRGRRIKAGRKATIDSFAGIDKRTLDAIQRQAIEVMDNNKRMRRALRMERK